MSDSKVWWNVTTPMVKGIMNLISSSFRAFALMVGLLTISSVLAMWRWQGEMSFIGSAGMTLGGILLLCMVKAKWWGITFFVSHVVVTLKRYPLSLFYSSRLSASSSFFLFWQMVGFKVKFWNAIYHLLLVGRNLMGELAKDSLGAKGPES